VRWAALVSVPLAFLLACGGDEPLPGTVSLFPEIAVEAPRESIERARPGGDATERLPIPAVLDRAARLLAASSGKKKEKELVDCGGQPYLGAALGLALGASARTGEVTRALRWQRIAPPAGAGQTGNRVDERRLHGSWVYRKGETADMSLLGREATQAAPARIARGMPLPEVSADEPPYVVASRHPNGAVAVATLPRTGARRGLYYPLAGVSIDVDKVDALIGVFGSYAQLTLQFGRSVAGRRVLAQDLAAETPVDITALVHFGDSSVTLPGTVIQRAGLLAAAPGDLSDPGLVLRLVAESDAPLLEPPAVAAFEWTGEAEAANVQAGVRPESRRVPPFPAQTFGDPRFIQFGQDDTGANADVVYALSAGGSGRRLLLGRVQRSRISDADAWEWVSSFDGGHTPLWTNNHKWAVPVLSGYYGVGQPEMIHVEALERYLLVTLNSPGRSSLEAAVDFAVYEAKQPWGPFSIVYREEFTCPGGVIPKVVRISPDRIEKTPGGIEGRIAFSDRNGMAARWLSRPFRIRRAW